MVNNSVGRIAVTVAVAYFTGYYQYGGWGYGITGSSSLGLTNAVVGGAAGAFAGSGGDFRAAIQGGITAAAFYGVGSFADSQGWAAGSLGRTGAHALVGCGTSAAFGGNCSTGAIAAGFAQAVGPKLQFQEFAANVAARAIVGGTASILGGGKFENGALSAAFAYMFNDAGHAKERLQKAMDDLQAGLKYSAETGCIGAGGADICIGPGATKLTSENAMARLLTTQELKSIRSLERQIELHEEKIAAFKANPTIRPGMENLPREMIERQQQSRIDG